jgi:CheY-like chemotaxis protein
LVVDDNEIQRTLASELLAPLGFRVLVAASGRECVALAERGKPNLILLDIAMPEMDGWQVAQRLRARPDRPAILMLSANAIEPSRLSDAERLHDDYLMKPVDLRQLLKKIHALLDIEWVYEDKAPPAVPSTGALAAVPQAGDIEELIRLGEIGHVRRIHEKLSAIATSAPDCADFVARMRAFVTSFDLKRYVAALETIRDSHA